MHIYYFIGNNLSILGYDNYNEYFSYKILQIKEQLKLKRHPWEKEPIKDIKNPVFEEELKKSLDAIYKNRTNLDWSTLRTLEKISNKKWGYHWGN